MHVLRIPAGHKFVGLKILQMNRIDHFFQKIQLWIRSKPLLYRFTLGIRALLAIGFIPTGMVKLLGYRFTTMSPESDIGAFFEVMYQSGIYWNFLGFTQVLAGILVLIPAASALGALLFLGIMMNIFLITISYDFNFTPFITFQMLLASIWLVIWDYDRFRNLIFKNELMPAGTGRKYRKLAAGLQPLPRLTLENYYERTVYITGTAAGILFFGMLRGPILPEGFSIVLLIVCSICFISAIVFSFRNAKD